MLGAESIVVSSVVGNTQLLDGGSMFGNAPRPLWERWVAPDELGRIPLACRAMLVELSHKKILCETGIGSYMAPDLASRYGVVERNHILLESLAELDVTDDAIDYVILSHLHFDHAGGLLKPYQENGSLELLFPNAKYVVGRTAWERAKQPHFRDKASFIPGLTDLLEASGRLLIVEGEEIPGLPKEIISLRVSEGHTPGQLHTVVRGSAHTIVYAGDLIPGKAWVHLPITMGYDRYPERLIDEKEELYQEVVKGRWMVFYTHDSKVAASEIEKDPKGRFVPVHDHANLKRFALNS